MVSRSKTTWTRLHTVEGRRRLTKLLTIRAHGAPQSRRLSIVINIRVVRDCDNLQWVSQQ